MINIECSTINNEVVRGCENIVVQRLNTKKMRKTSIESKRPPAYSYLDLTNTALLFLSIGCRSGKQNKITY